MGDKQKKIIGIVGGMGPQAGLDLLQNIISNTTSKKDQDHLSAILMSFPDEIVDRTLFLEGKVNENPAHSIIKIIRKLELVGAHIIGIACNTSHSPEIFDLIEESLVDTASEVKLIHMPKETCKHLKVNYNKLSKIGLMTTNGTYKTGIYRDLLITYGFEPVVPDFYFQDSIINRIIYDKEIGLKACTKKEHPELQQLFEKAIAFFKQQGVSAIILGCTELAIIAKEPSIDGMTIIDPANILAKALIKEAKCDISSLINEQSI